MRKASDLTWIDSELNAIFFLCRIYDVRDTGHQSYVGIQDSDGAISQFFQEYFSFLILFNYLIPISLYVTIELHKFVGSLFLEWDRDLYDIDTNQQCLVNTSDLNEELGQVKILFSDKTGTLTKNEMILQQCSINGKKYKILDNGMHESGKLKPMKLQQYDGNVLNFFQALSVCHTVQVENESVDQNEELIEENFEASFEVIESFTSLIDRKDEDVQRMAETRSNTFQNAITSDIHALHEAVRPTASNDGESKHFRSFVFDFH